jgi:wobble nucleotide-excising tRNase
MATIRNIRLLKGAAVLAERKAATPSLELQRYNLFYGFNGSGKSTLSRIFAALQLGKVHDRLPEGCTFEIEMSDGTKFTYPRATTGLEKRICVFNNDFVEENLRWESGAANPVFYIGADQAEAAEKLMVLEAALPTTKATHEGEQNVVSEREKAFSNFKRDLARIVSERLRQRARYEATQLVADVEKLGATAAHILSDADLDAATATCARSEPPAKVDSVKVPISALLKTIEAAFNLVPKSVGTVLVEGLKDHPAMVPWAKQAHEYHISHRLASCLYCGGPLTDQRKDLLTAAFDDRLSAFIVELDAAVHEARQCVEVLNIAKSAIPAAAQLSSEFQPSFEAAASNLTAALDDVRPLLVAALEALQQRKGVPTTALAVQLPPLDEIKERLGKLEASCAAVNAICHQHGTMVDEFTEHQSKARESIRRHFVASRATDYSKHENDIDTAKSREAMTKQAVEDLEKQLTDLRAKVQQHGPAADKINALVRSYLGHSELTIVAVAEGYELHRHGALMANPPSEGEKTAIALCYFLSTLDAEGRKLSDLIIVVDDPVSSLDTKAMNYACGLIRNRLSGAAQLIVLTHNQNCMNEFKKPWKGAARATPPTASLKFIDVSVPPGGTTRTAVIVDLPKHLREYDSEYHYLFEKILAFEKAGGGHFDYAFMMPNVLRKVLEIFLAFRIPHNGPLTDKLQALCGRHEALDQNRVNALERLSQVESHSDSLDDLIAQSSMTVEESRDANAALIHLMEEVDKPHLNELRKYCKP